jgi:nucleotide-binding universal stress UspA family protein
MGKKILLAVDECIHSRQVLKYAARVCAAAGDVTYTLFHVEPYVPEVFRRGGEKNPAVKAELDQLLKKKADVKACISDSLKQVLVNEGVPEGRIEVIVKPLEKGMAKDILNYAEEGGYEAIALARTGLTSSRDFFIGTTAAKIVEHALNTPVWIIDGPSTDMDFLLAVDGSENSLRDVDHIVRMVGPNKNLELTLFHVLPHLRHYYSLEEEKRCPNLQAMLHEADGERMKVCFREVNKKLQDGGIDERQIRTKTNTMSYDISTAVLDEAKTMGYSTVVVGRRGERSAFFTGRIAIRLVQKVVGQTLWILP